MKKIATLAALGAASLLLAGCSLMGTKTTTTSTGTVESTMVSVDIPRQECLDSSYQWDDQKEICEKFTPKEACLRAGNQRDEKTNRCEFSKDNCLTAGNQWNEQTSSCEFHKEQCLEQNAQRDEQKSVCEFRPVTIEQQMEDCLAEENAQWDHQTSTCEKRDPNASATTETAVKTYTMTEVATHNSQSSCWTTIRGNVYDLTTWIPQHPGGAQMIMALCGKDGSDAFGAKHSGDTKPETMLASFQIGVLAK